MVFDIKGAKSIERETPTVSFDYTHEFANLDLEHVKIDLTVIEIDDEEAFEDASLNRWLTGAMVLQDVKF